MSSVANWSYTATATIWRRIRDADGSDTDGGGQPYGWEAPIAILCDYQGGLSAKSVTSAGRSWLKHDMDRVRNGAGRRLHPDWRFDRCSTAG